MSSQPVVYDYQDLQIDQPTQVASNKAIQRPQIPVVYSYSEQPARQSALQPVKPILLQAPVAEVNDNELARQIADLLTEDDTESKKQATPFVKEALPGEKQTFTSNGFYLGIVRFCAIFFVCLHLFVYGSVFSLWGNGNLMMISISSIQLLCAAYSFTIASVEDKEWLKLMIDLKTVYQLLVALVVAPVGLATFMAFYAYQQSDQLASYTISSNFLSYAGVTILPFVSLVFVTVFVWDMRAYELNDSDIEFDPDYHHRPSVEQRKNANMSKELTIQLLKRYLDEPPQPELVRSSPSTGDFEIKYL